jgi:2-aminoadipate transaminase
MRLNFSSSDEDSIREGIRRIGEVIKEQVALYGTLTGKEQLAPEPAGAPETQADVVELPRRADRRREAQ